MGRSTTIQVRVEPKTKKEAQNILERLNISLSEAISMFLTQVVFHHGIPFELKIPNEVTAETIAKLEAGQDVHKTSSAEELFKELER
jgi:DNA-damage-inducible protein J